MIDRFPSERARAFRPDPDVLLDVVRHKARLAVCDAATDATEAAEMLLMLGLHPSQEGMFAPAVDPSDLKF